MQYTLKALKVSDKFIKKLTKYGSSIELCTSKKPSNSGTEQDNYAEFYGQSKDEHVDIEDTLTIVLHTLAEYSPNVEKIIGGGLDKNCDIMITFITKELIDNKFLGDVDLNSGADLDLVIYEKKLRNKLVLLNGNYYQIDKIKPEGILSQSPIATILFCSLYVTE